MKILKLDTSFYPAHTHLKQALDNYDGNWDADKIRGYGITIINFNNLKFAIPLKSCIRHKALHLTVNNPSKDGKKGLDFSKALLITDDKYITGEIYWIDNEEYKNIQGKERFITAKFEKYVEKYIKAIRKLDNNILQSWEYRNTTLQNYHSDLGL